MANRVHQVTSARSDLAEALNGSEGVRDIKIGKLALRKLIKQAEQLLAANERVEFASYYYERGFTIVTYYLIVVTDRRVMRVNRTTWKLKPWIQERDSVTSIEVSSGTKTPRVTLRRGDVNVAPFLMVRADADRLAKHLGERSDPL